MAKNKRTQYSAITDDDIARLYAAKAHLEVELARAQWESFNAREETRHLRITVISLRHEIGALEINRDAYRTVALASLDIARQERNL